jgi:hypothetical protein
VELREVCAMFIFSLCKQCVKHQLRRQIRAFVL